MRRSTDRRSGTRPARCWRLRCSPLGAAARVHWGPVPPRGTAERPPAAPRARRRPRRTSASPSGFERLSPCAHRLAGERLRLEDLRPEPDAEVGELLRELRTNARRLEVATEAAVLVDTHAVVEQEDVLEGDDVTFHALHLGHVRDATRTVAQT